MRPTALPSVHRLNLVVGILLAALPLCSLPLAAQPPAAAPLPWHRAVISAYFEEKGLVRQQLDSFDEFINTSLQEIVDDNNLLTITPQRQHLPGLQVEEDVEETR